MKMNWSDILLATGLTAAGCTLVYIRFLRALHKAVAERQMKFDQSLGALAAGMETLHRRIDEMSTGESKSPPKTDNVNNSASAETSEPESEPLQPETLAVITAAATTFLGKKAQIRAAHAQPAENAAGAWAQQGRVIVQTSHTPRPRA